MAKKKISRKKKLLIAAVVAVVVAGYAVYWHNWPFTGRVVDAETGKPIAGAVVVAKWNDDIPTISGGNQRLKDVKETLTDEDGRWRITGPKGDNPIGNVISFLPYVTWTRSPRFIVFKPGYCPYSTSAFGLKACDGLSKEGGRRWSLGFGETIKLPKLTEREDRLAALPGPIHARGNLNEHDVLRKQKVFFTYINQERRELGLSEYQSYYEVFGDAKDEK